MRNTLPILALLSFAATAAQADDTIVLNPAPGALSGYLHTTVDGTTTGYSLKSGLVTTTTSIIGTKKYPAPTTIRYTGWRAEFDLPAAPAGEILKSAILIAKTPGWMSITSLTPIVLRRYDGSGAIQAADPASSNVPIARRVPPFSPVDVTAFLGTGRYVGFDFSCAPLMQDAAGTGGEIYWRSPTLTLTYTPSPVPEPAPLAALGALVFLRRRARRA